MISASIYNSQKKIGWKLPRDITTTYSDDPHNIEIKRIGLPRDMTYEITTYGYGDLGVSDVRWYLRKMGTDRSCTGISDCEPKKNRNLPTPIGRISE
jgi:hypothetical protein